MLYEERWSWSRLIKHRCVFVKQLMIEDASSWHRALELNSYSLITLQTNTPGDFSCHCSGLYFMSRCFLWVCDEISWIEWEIVLLFFKGNSSNIHAAGVRSGVVSHDGVDVTTPLDLLRRLQAPGSGFNNRKITHTQFNLLTWRPCEEPNQLFHVKQEAFLHQLSWCCCDAAQRIDSSD